MPSQKIKNFLCSDERVKRTKGITLVVLVITIVILLILAGITISSLTGENGLIAKVNQAKKVQAESEMQESLTLVIDDLQIEKQGKATLDDITENYLQEKMSEYEVKVISDASTSGKQIIIKKEEIQKKFVLDENLNIIEIENTTGTLKFSYEVGVRLENKVKILITVEDEENGIEKIIFPDQDALICNKSKEIIGIDYEVELGTEHKIKIILGNGEEKEETILIEEYYYIVERNLDIGLDIDNKAIKTAYNKPYTATIITDKRNRLKKLEVKMNGQIITTDENNIVNESTGEIYIKNIIGNIEITATKRKSLLNENLIEGEVQLSGQQKINSNAIITTPQTFILSVEAKLLEGYYNGNPTNAYGPLVGVGNPASGWGGSSLGIFYRNGVICFNNGISDSQSFYINVTEKIDVTEWNEFSMIWDGKKLECYINDELVGSRTAVSWKNTQLFIGGWLNAPMSVAGKQWGFANGIYRNLIFLE